YRLCGVIYFGGFHFTARIISTNGHIWFNDGKETGQNCTDEGILTASGGLQLCSAGNRHMTIGLYVKV
ncbi:uncharacterized protein B0H18DRAFT_827734, partial [Fomitopsis serialis]|uniref:uncharacterized protein n=1 Tax=Fomitopsis serialis TaxID=139415 RepID=UPI002007E96B